MKKFSIIISLLLLILPPAAQVQICIENDTCYSATPMELNVPDFVVIDEATGRMTVAVSRDGLAVSVFGACTDTDL